MNVKKDRKDYSTNSGGINAFLGKGTEFDGKLIFDGVVRLDGKFKGEIISNDTLVVGESAVLNAEIKVDTIIISGKISGNIFAKNRVEIHAPGKLYGNVQTPVFVIEEGVIFEGSCSMERKHSKELRPELKPGLKPELKPGLRPELKPELKTVEGIKK
jgi:cytoskeletal protein CcmA (bactofilin family)